VSATRRHPTQEIGVNFIDGVADNYIVEMTDPVGTFHVWARNLDRALDLRQEFCTASGFNLRNLEIDFDTLDEVGSTDNSTYRVEVMTPAQLTQSPRFRWGTL
jgi:hypothetical protein